MKERIEDERYIIIHTRSFLQTKCFYCDFPSYANIDYLKDDYVNALCKEIENSKITYNIKSIFIGGGTPSI